MTKLNIEQRAVADLIPYAANSRTHSDEQVAQIAASIKEFGWTNPILIDGDNTIIAGHGRLLAARKLGMEEVPAIVLDHLSKAQQKALVIADNQLALNAGWDMDMLKAEIEGLNLEGFDLDLIAFDAATLEELLQGGSPDLGLLPEEKMENFLNGDTKILRLAYDEQEFCDITDALQHLQEKTGADDFSTIVLDLVMKSWRK